MSFTSAPAQPIISLSARRQDTLFAESAVRSGIQSCPYPMLPLQPILHMSPFPYSGQAHGLIPAVPTAHANIPTCERLTLTDPSKLSRLNGPVPPTPGVPNLAACIPATPETPYQVSSHCADGGDGRTNTGLCLSSLSQISASKTTGQKSKGPSRNQMLVSHAGNERNQSLESLSRRSRGFTSDSNTTCINQAYAGSVSAAHSSEVAPSNNLALLELSRVAADAATGTDLLLVEGARSDNTANDSERLPGLAEVLRTLVSASGPNDTSSLGRGDLQPKRPVRKLRQNRRNSLQRGMRHRAKQQSGNKHLHSTPLLSPPQSPETIDYANGKVSSGQCSSRDSPYPRGRRLANSDGSRSLVGEQLQRRTKTDELDTVIVMGERTYIRISEGRRCISCGSTESPCWRPSWSPEAGQLCNSCGLRWKKTRVRCMSSDCLYIPAGRQWTAMVMQAKAKPQDKCQYPCPRCKCPLLCFDE